MYLVESLYTFFLANNLSYASEQRILLAKGIIMIGGN